MLAQTVQGRDFATREKWAHVAEVFLIVLTFFVYFGARGFVVERVGEAEANAEALISLQKSLGIFWEVELQKLILEHDWMRRLANSVYLYGHGPAILIVAILLYTRARQQYYLVRNAFLLSGAIGLVIFVAFPVAPPRLMPEFGFVDTVLEEYNVRRVLMPGFLTNEYAAVPSLHFGWNLIIGVALWTVFPNAVARFFAIAAPLGMFLAIVLTANHFILDAVAGAVVVAAGSYLAFRLKRLAETKVRSGDVSGESLRWLLGAPAYDRSTIGPASRLDGQPDEAVARLH
jgi:hypothetical protein